MNIKVLLIMIIFSSGTLAYAGDTTIKGTTSNSSAAALEATNSSDVSLLFVRNDGNVGVGDTTPASLFTVGSGDLLQINSSGDLVKLKNVTYSWPGTQGGSNTFLKNDGSGNLTWTTVSSGAGNTLDQSYDQGGAGAGRSVTVDTGAVQLNGSNAADETLEVFNTAAGGAMLIENSGSGDSFRVNDSAGDASPFLIDNAGNAGIGDATPDAALEVLSATEQLRLSQTDNTNDSRFTVDASGNLTIDNTGTKTIVADDLQVTGNDILDSSATSRLTLGATNTVTGNLSATGTLASGTASAANGALIFSNSTNANTITIQSGATSATHSLTLPTAQGSANTFLKNNGSGTLSWATTSANYAFSTKTSNYTITSTDDVIAADAAGGAVTITLPTAAGITGRQFTVKRINTGANTVTVATTGGQTIDGDATQILNLPQTSISMVSDGTNWVIV